MDKIDRTRYRQLANDAVIATFGESSLTSQLAEALEKCVDELELIATDCEHCKTCEYHGDVEDDSIHINVGDVVGIHGELKKLLQQFKDYHVKLCGEVAEDWADPDQLTEPLAELIDETDMKLDELEALTFI